MKRFLSFIVVLAVACSCMLFVACGHEHTWASDWSSDATNHWKVCTGENCQEKTETAAHTYENGACSVCAYAHADHTYENGACTVCGGAKPINYEVTDAEWTAGLSLGNSFTQNQIQTYQSGIKMVTVGKFDSTIGMSYVQEQYMGETLIMSVGQYYEIDSANDKVYSYSPVFSQDYSTILGYEKEEAYIDFSTMDSSFLPDEVANKSNYTFNATTKAYEAELITVQLTAEITNEYKNVSVKFQDGELISVTYNEGEGELASTVVITVSRGNVSITFPEPYVAEPSITPAEWNAMFHVAQNMTMTKVSTYSDEMVTLIGKFAANGMQTTMVFSSSPAEILNTYFEFDVANDKVWRYEEEPEGVYTKVPFTFGYTQYMSNVTLESGELTNFENYTYNSLVDAYVAESIVDNDQTYTNVVIKVQDGKLMLISYDSEDNDGAYNYVLSCTYGDTVVNLPAAQPAE